jgi:hypothetical protein
LLRELFAITALHNIVIKASYIKSEDNVVADFQSRLNNPEFALVAAELLLSADIYLLHPGFQWHAHMSFQTALYISQVCSQLSMDIWMLMWPGIEQPHLPSLQRPPMPHSDGHFSDSAGILDIKLSHVLKSPLPDMQRFWRDHSALTASQVI